MRGFDVPAGGNPARAALEATVVMELDHPFPPGLRLDVDLAFDPADPLTLRLSFRLPGGTRVSWSVSRDLLLRGLEAPSGEGDIRVRPLEAHRVQIELRGADGHAVQLIAPSAAVGDVLLRSCRLVPPGRELPPRALERELARLLAACRD